MIQGTRDKKPRDKKSRDKPRDNSALGRLLQEDPQREPFAIPTCAIPAQPCFTQPRLPHHLAHRHLSDRWTHQPTSPLQPLPHWLTSPRAAPTPPPLRSPPCPTLNHLSRPHSLLHPEPPHPSKTAHPSPLSTHTQYVPHCPTVPHPFPHRPPLPLDSLLHLVAHNFLGLE